MFRKVSVKDRLPTAKGHYHIVDIDGNNDAYGFEPTDEEDVRQWRACVDYWLEEIAEPKQTGNSEALEID